MAEVRLNVYDVTNSSSEGANRAVAILNNVGHSIGLGGVFHGAVEVYGEEWSFGYCPEGTGVYNCTPRENPFYTFRQTMELGTTTRSSVEVAALLRRMKAEWPGSSYNLLNKNCCHFCEDMCKDLGSQQVPRWLNRMASGTEGVLQFADKVVDSVLTWSSQISHGSQCAVSWFRSPFRNWNNPIVHSAEEAADREHERSSMRPETAPLIVD